MLCCMFEDITGMEWRRKLRKGVLFHQDNAQVHTVTAMDTIHKCGSERYQTFLNMKKALAGTHSNDDIIASVENI